jgi:photosystem II stability/assembly factor-like uncharacterized protein
MESMKGPFEERNTDKKQRVATTKLLATLLLSSLILLVGCGSQSNIGSPGDTSSTPTASSPTSEALQKIHMIDAKTGWAMTQSAVLRTVDGGVHWKVVAPPGNPRIAFMDAMFLTASTAWIGISQATSSTILVFRTEDGGQTWQQSSVQTSISTQVQVSAIDSQHGWILNHIGGGPQAEIVEIFRTSDGGKNWARVTQVYPASTDAPPPGRLPYGGSKSGLSFVNATTGWVTGSVPVNSLTWVYVTRDGGSTWQRQALPPIPHATAALLSFLPATFFTAKDGILPVNFVGDKGSGFAVYATNNGGNTWKSVPTAQPSSLMAAVDFIDINHGWAIDKDSGNLYTTNDGGQHWTKLAFTFTSNSVPSFKFLDFVTSKIGWAIGAAGPDTTVLLKTVDGGHTWAPVPYTIS